MTFTENFVKAEQARDMVDRYFTSQLDRTKFNVPQLIHADLAIRSRTAVYALRYLRIFGLKPESMPIAVGMGRTEAWKNTFPAPIPSLHKEVES